MHVGPSAVHGEKKKFRQAQSGSWKPLQLWCGACRSAKTVFGEKTLAAEPCDAKTGSRCVYTVRMRRVCRQRAGHHQCGPLAMRNQSRASWRTWAVRKQQQHWVPRGRNTETKHLNSHAIASANLVVQWAGQSISPTTQAAASQGRCIRPCTRWHVDAAAAWNRKHGLAAHVRKRST